ncbi:hypothetical protein [Methanosarcina barkeri]|nr:hypothetical protein [Methanosarcina barkeri]
MKIKVSCTGNKPSHCGAIILSSQGFARVMYVCDRILLHTYY